MGKTKKTNKRTVKTLRIALWAGIFLLVAMIISGAMSNKKGEAVAGVLVDIQPLADGHYLIDSTDVPEILEDRFAHPLTAFNVGQVDVKRVEKVLKEYPFVLDADAFVDARNRVNIKIEQREPLLRVKDNNGLDYYLDKEGNQMPPSAHHAARVRIFTGNFPPYEDDFMNNRKNLLTQAFALNEKLRHDPFLDALIEQVYVNKRGELVLSPKVGRQIIHFGRYNKVDDKLKRLKVFYREGLPYKGWQAYKSFDLRYDGQVVCAKR